MQHQQTLHLYKRTYVKVENILLRTIVVQT